MIGDWETLGDDTCRVVRMPFRNRNLLTMALAVSVGNGDAIVEATGILVSNDSINYP